MKDTDEYLSLVPAGGSFVDVLAQKTPWWVLSTLIHAICILFMWLVIRLDPLEEPVAEALINPWPPDLKTFEMKEEKYEETKIKEPESIIREPKIPEHIDLQVPEREIENRSEDLLPHKKFDSVIGVGPPAGDRSGGLGDRIRRVEELGRSPEVDKALLWLARHQDPEGGWSIKEYVDNCGKYYGGTCDTSPRGFGGRYDIGVTGLATLAFLGAGIVPSSRLTDEETKINLGATLRKALNYIINRQNMDGSIGPKVDEYMYNHTICALALAEVYGMTKNRFYRTPAYKSIYYILDAQNEGKGWRYEYKSGDNDTSVTGWAVMVLKSAEMWNFKEDQDYINLLQRIKKSYQGAKRWIEEVTAPQSDYENRGRCGYTKIGDKIYWVSFFKEGGAKNDHFLHQESMTAIGAMVRMFIDKNENDPIVAAAISRLMQQPPRWEKVGEDGCPIDFYYWYYATLALYQYAGGSTNKEKHKIWEQWDKHMSTAIKLNQISKPERSCKVGSWDPVGKWCGAGGRVYATAINALSLEVYYRYPSVFTGK